MSCRTRREILGGIDFELPPPVLAVLGENGAGKTTLYLLMGFRRRSAGTIQAMGQDPGTDPWESRARIAYLSEKHDVPGDWEAGDASTSIAASTPASTRTSNGRSSSRSASGAARARGRCSGSAQRAPLVRHALSHARA